MANEAYTDLEQDHIKKKYESSHIEYIIYLTKIYPNNNDLGTKIREFINKLK
jgi:hypothetical protein